MEIGAFQSHFGLQVVKQTRGKREEMKDLAYISALGKGLFGPWRTAAVYYVLLLPEAASPGQDKRRGLLDVRGQGEVNLSDEGFRTKSVSS
jgi:hypothetical protein